MSRAKAPFERLPHIGFRIRLAFVLMPLVWIAFVAVGVMGYSRLDPLPPTSHTGEGNPYFVSMSFYKNYLAAWKAAPEGCVEGHVISDFQHARCSEFWSRMGQASAIGVLPLIVLMLGYMIGMDALRGTYRRVRKKIESRKALGRGVVVKPSRASNDFFGWYYGFRAVNVQIERAGVIRTYFARSERRPVPGDGVAVFSIGGAVGRERYFGIYYAPHVAVIAGMTQD